MNPLLLRAGLGAAAAVAAAAAARWAGRKETAPAIATKLIDASPKPVAQEPKQSTRSSQWRAVWFFAGMVTMLLMEVMAAVVMNLLVRL
jgi:hypothetical protein